MHATVDGRVMNWTEAGEKHGQVLFLLHGFPFNANMWQAQLEAVPARWRFIAPDLAGYGASEADGRPLTMDRFADDVVALAQHLGVQRAVFGGLSMGGYILFALMRRNPQLVRALVLSDTKAGADSPETRATRLKNADVIAANGTTSFVDEMVPKLLAPRTRRVAPAVESQLRTIMHAAPAATVAATLRGLAERPDSSGMLDRIEVPALLIVGAEDQITPPTEARFMARSIRGAVLIEIEDAGHVPNLEQPAVFNRALSSFLTSLA
jgi:pimeloyl-ACP methyl ester carboxylesterase